MTQGVVQSGPWQTGVMTAGRQSCPQSKALLLRYQAGVAKERQPRSSSTFLAQDSLGAGTQGKLLPSSSHTLVTHWLMCWGWGVVGVKRFWGLLSGERIKDILSQSDPEDALGRAVLQGQALQE